LPTASDFITGKNFGDLPAPFILTITGITIGDKLTVGSLEIVFQENVTGEVTWNSRNGLVTKIVDGKAIPIKYTGRSYGTIPKNGLTTSEIYYTYKDDTNLRRIFPDKTRKQYDPSTQQWNNISSISLLPYKIDYQFWYY
jgi:hypothetical protein